MGRQAAAGGRIARVAGWVNAPAGWPNSACSCPTAHATDVVTGTAVRNWPSFVDNPYFAVSIVYEDFLSFRFGSLGSLPRPDRSVPQQEVPWEGCGAGSRASKRARLGQDASPRRNSPGPGLNTVHSTMIETLPLDHQVFDALERNPYIARRCLRFETSEGRVTLRGVVGTYFQKQMAQEAVRHVAGVREIANELEVSWA
jgi:hypothetical protein